MNVKTRRPIIGPSIRLFVEKRDGDNEILIGSDVGSFYLHISDVPRFISAVKWAAKAKRA